MYPQFSLEGDTSPARERSPEEQKRLEIIISRILAPEEHRRLESLLLERLKQHKPELEDMLNVMNAHWTYEDHVYRYYHSSWKVYATQRTTENAVNLLRRVLPERQLNIMFEEILKEGTGKEFEDEHNDQWGKHTRPILEAFFHTKFMVEMALRYADLPKSPQPFPSGYAAFLYLYDLR